MIKKKKWLHLANPYFPFRIYFSNINRSWSAGFGFFAFISGFLYEAVRCVLSVYLTRSFYFFFGSLSLNLIFASFLGQNLTVNKHFLVQIFNTVVCRHCFCADSCYAPQVSLLLCYNDDCNWLSLLDLKLSLLFSTVCKPCMSETS